MQFLLDVNVLIALTWPHHEHHDRAHGWFAAHAEDGWATCPMTQCGFVRISTNPVIMKDNVATMADALTKLNRMLTHPNHVFWPDDIQFAEERVPHRQCRGHRQVTDAYLLGLAKRRGGRLATLDAGTLELAAADTFLID
jgi:uncharacterized protein